MKEISQSGMRENTNHLWKCNTLSCKVRKCTRDHLWEGYESGKVSWVNFTLKEQEQVEIYKCFMLQFCFTWFVCKSWKWSGVFFSPMKAGGKFGLKPRRIEHRGLSDSALEASFCVYVVERSSSFCHSQWLNDKGYFNFLLVMLNNSDHC